MGCSPTYLEDAKEAPKDMSPSDAPRDGAPPDVLFPLGVQCGQPLCSVGQVCCYSPQIAYCATSCPDGGIITAVLACDGPEDCSGNPCCVVLKSSTTAACTQGSGECEHQFRGRQGGGQSRVCHVDGDCTAGIPNTSAVRCCTMKWLKMRICVTKAEADSGGSEFDCS